MRHSAPTAQVWVYDISDPTGIPEMLGDPGETYPDLDLALKAAARLTEPDRWVVVMEAFAREIGVGLGGGHLFMSVHDSELIDVTEQEHLGWRNILRRWDEIVEHIKGREPEENPSKAIKWSKGPGSTGHWLGYVDGVGQDVAGLFLREASWRILRTPKGWILHDWDGTGWHFSYAGETLAEVKRVAEQRQGEARENPTNPSLSANIYVYDISEGRTDAAFLIDSTYEQDLNLALEAAKRFLDLNHWVVVAEARSLDGYEGGRTFMSVRDSRFTEVTQHLAGNNPSWLHCLERLLKEVDTLENPARLSDVSHDIINAQTVFNLSTDLHYVAVYRDVFSEDEIKAFVEYCHMALSSVPEEDQWRIRAQWVRDQDNPLGRGNIRQADDARHYGRPRTIVLELAEGRLAVRTIAHAAAREASPSQPRPQFDRTPTGTVDMSYVEYAIPAFMRDEPDRKYAKAPLVLANHDDIISTGDWVYTPSADTKDRYGRPSPLGRYTFVGARHPGEEQ